MAVVDVTESNVRLYCSFFLLIRSYNSTIFDFFDTQTVSPCNVENVFFNKKKLSNEQWSYFSATENVVKVTFK